MWWWWENLHLFELRFFHKFVSFFSLSRLNLFFLLLSCCDELIKLQRRPNAHSSTENLRFALWWINLHIFYYDVNWWGRRRLYIIALLHDAHFFAPSKKERTKKKFSSKWWSITQLILVRARCSTAANYHRIHFATRHQFLNDFGWLMSALESAIMAK